MVTSISVDLPEPAASVTEPQLDKRDPEQPLPRGSCASSSSGERRLASLG